MGGGKAEDNMTHTILENIGQEQCSLKLNEEGLPEKYFFR